MNVDQLKKIRIALITLGVIIFLFIGYQNFAFDGELEGVYGNHKRSAFISNLTPTSRLLKTDNKELIGAMKLEPVYLDLRLTRPFESLKLELIYKKPQDVKLLVGHLVDKADWRFFNKSVDEYSEVLVDGWSKAIIDYDITTAQEENENIYKLGFSSPGLDAKNLEEAIQVKDVKLTLSKVPVTMKNFWFRFKNYLERIF